MSEDKIEQGVYPAAHDEAAALVGGFAYDAAHDRWSWSPEVFRIHGFEPHDVVPTTQLIVFHAHPDDRDAVAETLARAMAAPRRFNLTFRLVDAQGETRRVMLLGSGSGDEGDVRLRGQLVDLTSWQDQILNDDLGPVVDDFRAHRAVIEQAKGVLVLAQGVTADEAFELLRAYSQDNNIKVRDVAARLVERAAEQDPADGDFLRTVLQVFDLVD